jgi:hypothetical protein
MPSFYIYCRRALRHSLTENLFHNLMHTIFITHPKSKIINTIDELNATHDMVLLIMEIKKYCSKTGYLSYWPDISFLVPVIQVFLTKCPGLISLKILSDNC